MYVVYLISTGQYTSPSRQYLVTALSFPDIFFLKTKLRSQRGSGQHRTGRWLDLNASFWRFFPAPSPRRPISTLRLLRRPGSRGTDRGRVAAGAFFPRRQSLAATPVADRKMRWDGSPLLVVGSCFSDCLAGRARRRELDVLGPRAPALGDFSSCGAHGRGAACRGRPLRRRWPAGGAQPDELPPWPRRRRRRRQSHQDRRQGLPG